MRYEESYVTAPRTGLGAILDSFIIAGGTTALALAIGLHRGDRLLPLPCG